MSQQCAAEEVQLESLAELLRTRREKLREEKRHNQEAVSVLFTELRQELQRKEEKLRRYVEQLFASQDTRLEKEEKDVAIALRNLRKQEIQGDAAEALVADVECRAQTELLRKPFESFEKWRKDINVDSIFRHLERSSGFHTEEELPPPLGIPAVGSLGSLSRQITDVTDTGSDEVSLPREASLKDMAAIVPISPVDMDEDDDLVPPMPESLPGAPSLGGDGFIPRQVTDVTSNDDVLATYAMANADGTFADPSDLAALEDLSGLAGLGLGGPISRQITDQGDQDPIG